MKIILSRKGFDSSNGGVPSPIFGDDGGSSLYSLPIALEHATTCTYADILWNGTNLHELISSLRRRKRSLLDDTPHLDPDLVRGALSKRDPNWRPIFGQSGPQETQLRTEGVDDPIDPKNRPLFLFFGWYRKVRWAETPHRYEYVGGAPNIHTVFGWLQVEKKIVLTGLSDRKRVAREMPWTAQHPHVASSHHDNEKNAIYVAPKPHSKSDRLMLGRRDIGLPASGMFSRFDPAVHTLTTEGRTRRHWSIPAWFYRNGDPRLGMHKQPWRWATSPDARLVELQSVDIGQEFVFDSKDYDEAGFPIG